MNVALWQVPDEATAKPMLGTYARVEELGDVRALAEVERRAVASELGEALRHPCSWAGFVQYGP